MSWRQSARRSRRRSRRRSGTSTVKSATSTRCSRTRERSLAHQSRAAARRADAGPSRRLRRLRPHSPPTSRPRASARRAAAGRARRLVVQRERGLIATGRRLSRPASQGSVADSLLGQPTRPPWGGKTSSVAARRIQRGDDGRSGGDRPCVCTSGSYLACGTCEGAKPRPSNADGILPPHAPLRPRSLTAPVLVRVPGAGRSGESR